MNTIHTTLKHTYVEAVGCVTASWISLPVSSIKESGIERMDPKVGLLSTETSMKKSGSND